MTPNNQENWEQNQFRKPKRPKKQPIPPGRSNPSNPDTPLPSGDPPVHNPQRKKKPKPKSSSI